MLGSAHAYPSILLRPFHTDEKNSNVILMLYTLRYYLYTYVYRHTVCNVTRRVA